MNWLCSACARHTETNFVSDGGLNVEALRGPEQEGGASTPDLPFVMICCQSTLLENTSDNSCFSCDLFTKNVMTLAFLFGSSCSN